MGIEKEESKSGGGYVGGFFQLFDWTAKSRKKLFSSKSDLQELSKQGKGSDGSLPRTRLRLMDDDDIGAGSSIRGGSDYSCASSVTDDEGYGAGAPGVVARLMGLDSMPQFNFLETNSTPFFDTQSLRDAYRGTGNFDFYHDHQITYSGNLLTKEDGPPRNLVKSKSQKSPGFIPSKTAAHIMEAAAKIIVPSPQAVTKATLPALGSSSLPLRVRDLKEKLEVAQKMPLKLLEDQLSRVLPKHLKGQSLNRSWNGSDDASYRVFSETDEDSSSSKTKGKSISLAIQAKVNVQRREGLNASGSQGFVGQKEQAEVSSSQRFKSQPNFQKSSQKRSPIHKASGALRQNNQKQNCMMDKEKLPSKPLVSNLQGKKVLSGNPPARLRAFGSKNGFRKLALDLREVGDALSTLLEQKLSELTKTVESSSSLSTFSSGGTAPRLHDNKDQSVPCIDRSDNYYDCRFSTDPAALRLKRILQGVDEMDCSSKSNDSRQLLNCRRPSPVSVLEHSFSNESSSLDSMDSCITEGSRHCSSIQVQEVHSLSSSKKFHFLDVDMELSDSASSSSAGTVDRKHANMLAVTGLARSTNWKGDKDTLESDGADARLERKLLFDCASECLDLRCRRHVSVGYKAWVKGTAMVRRKEWLGEDLCKEILEWSSMGDCMVDELVDKDMSSQYGRWLNFEVDAFEFGAEVESQVFNSLVNEVVADMLRF
ncbi:hypothetical protein OIU77_013997 [Salix suchowensis]|uniref:DUF4378 domain-containing protein n=1 Tax=Salix suchowensis TaxID=1278906 RepID=A0ABQ8ZW80_9ROSI|nr:hypothetical protein OIU77_013997 [Salix suchowensis]